MITIELRERYDSRLGNNPVVIDVFIAGIHAGTLGMSEKSWKAYRSIHYCGENKYSKVNVIIKDKS